MDPATASLIAGGAVSLLTKILVKAGKTFADTSDVADILGQFAGEKVAAVFNRIAGKAKEKPAADEAVKDVLSDPNNTDAQAALRNQLQKLMKEDLAFADDLEKLLDAAKPEAEKAGISIVVSGDGAAAMSGGAAAGKGGIAIVGDVEGGIQMPKPSDKD
jgi:hypothetical protein